MSLESDLYTYVVAQAAVSNHIGTRFFPNALLQSQQQVTAFPAATYVRASTGPIHTTDGRKTLTEVRVQIDTFGKGPTGYSDAKAAAAAIRTALEGYSGDMGDTDILSLRLEDYEDHPDKDLGVNDNRPFRIRMDFIIWCRET